MKRTVWIKLEAKGPQADRVFEVVNSLLDQGTPQDEINDSGFDFKITSATWDSTGMLTAPTKRKTR